MATKQKAKKAHSGRFVALPFAVIESDAFLTLNGSSVRLLIELVKQLNGSNNGDLCAAYKTLNKHARQKIERPIWHRKNINNAKQELLKKGLIEQTRKGGKNNGPSLYALSWLPIHAKEPRNNATTRGAKFWPLDVRPTTKASGLWKEYTEGAA